MGLILEHKLPQGFFLVYDERPPFPCLEVTQVHGKEIVTVIDKNQYTRDLKADGLMAFSSEHIPVLAVKTADCVPLVVLGKKGVALLHAGWKGVKEKIALEQKISCLEPYYFLIGPHIHSCCYEVQESFKDHFPGSNSFHTEKGKLYFSLLKELEKQLTENYPQAQIEALDLCTHCDKDFHSFRRDQTQKRNWNLLVS